MSGKTVAIIQSSYIPWKGYFDIIHDVDLFIFYDDVKFTKQDWRTRNRIKMLDGAHWLSVPVNASNHQLIHEVQLAGRGWANKHFRTLVQYYRRAPAFAWLRPLLEEIYLVRSWQSVSELNQWVITRIARLLGIETELIDSRGLGATGTATDRVIDLLVKVGATRYVSGPAARTYLDELRFADHGIELVYKDYSGYPEYPQPHPPFDHFVSILDLLASVGADTPAYIWGWRN